MLKAGETHRDAGLGIIEHRYSIHPSRDMPDKNDIHHHRVTSDGINQENIHHHTAVLKSRTNFSILCFKQSPDLSNGRYDAIASKAEHISLGRYDPARFTLFYAIIISDIGNKPRLVRLPNTADMFSVVDYIINETRVAVLYSFLSLPSPPHAEFASTITTAPEDTPIGLQDSMESTTNGLIWPAVEIVCGETFIDLSNAMLREINRREGKVFSHFISQNSHLIDFFSKGEMTPKIERQLQQRHLKKVRSDALRK